MRPISNNITARLQQKINNQAGAISFADFMDIALYAPQFGYYNIGAFDIGKHGDFTTAPEISPLFAQCIAAQASQLFECLGGGDVLEFGAGTGQFAHDLLCALERRGCLPAHYYIVEISDRLRQKQQEKLKAFCPSLFSRAVWIDAPPPQFVGLMVANEVLDALPVHCFHVGNTTISERCVAFRHGQFVWHNRPPFEFELMEEAVQICDRYRLPPGYQSEINLRLAPFIAKACQNLDKGVILIIDYGYGQKEYYHPERSSGTLSCFYQHQMLSSPLLFPGTHDITAHVDFTRAAGLAMDYGCSLLGFTTQSAFLLACGLLEFAAEIEKQLTPKEAFQLHQAIKRLTFPTEMGERTKVMGLSKKVDGPLLGFSREDRRRDL